LRYIAEVIGVNQEPFRGGLIAHRQSQGSYLISDPFAHR
jgi:hypothetical protein